MGEKKPKIGRRKLRGSYISSVISISLVLFLLGILGLLMLNAHKLSIYVKENISFSVIIKDQVKEVEIKKLQKELDATGYIKSTEYVSKENAARDLQEDLGEDFIDFLGYNPLLASIDVYLYADFANPDSISVIEDNLLSYPMVKEVFYQESLIHLINENVRKIGVFLLIFSGLLFLVAITLINNTIRLSVYAKRFIIHTMQLVGATTGFIRRPFLVKSSLHGVLGGLFAIILLLGLLYLIQKEFIEIFNFRDAGIIAILFTGIILTGIVLNWISTYFAVNKYLRMEEDELF